MDDKTISEWLSSDEGKAWEEGVYEDGFDEGWDNAKAVLGGLDIPDETIPTLNDDDVWRIFGNDS
jgi:hypothetical protein